MILDRLMGMGPRASTPAADDDYWYTEINPPTASGVKVTPDSALRDSAVMACVRVRAETVASLPLHLYEHRPDGGKQRARDHPLYQVLHNRPNRWQTSFEWREMMVGHLDLRGNGYSEIISGRRGAVSELIPLHPDRVTVERLPTGVLGYDLQLPDGGTRRLTQEEMLHIRGLSLDGILGLNPIEYARETIGVAIATKEHGARFFSNGAQPGGALIHPGKLRPDTKRGIRRAWNEAHAGRHNPHRVAVLDEGLKWEAIGLNNEDSQWLETMNFWTRDIARIYRVQPHMIGDLKDATFSNIEHEGINFIVHTIRPILTRFEQSLSRDLISAPERYFAEFTVDGLLRGDSKSRGEAYSLGIQNGWLSPNEVRRFENLNPREGGDEYLTPLNMRPSGGGSDADSKAAASRRDSKAGASRQDLQDSDDLVNLVNHVQPVNHVQGNTKAAFEELITEAAGRIARAELVELAKHWPKAGDDRERFDRWVHSFYKSHEGYVYRTILPIANAWEIETGWPAGPWPAVDRVVDPRRKQLLDHRYGRSDFVWPADAEEKRQATITGILREEILNAREDAETK